MASLQSRGIWRQEPVNFSADDIVQITDDDIAPPNWSIGQVVQVMLGHDGLTRVAFVRTSRGEITRPISKLRRLPAKDNDLHTANDERNDHKG